MRITGGAVSARTVSSSSRTDVRAVLLEMLLLMGLGALAVAWHAFARGRFDLAPGHQGFVWMALMMAGRMRSPLPFAGITTATGAAGATFLPVWRLGGDPFLWVYYYAAGAVVDLGSAGFLRSRHVLWIVPIIGGLAHATKPVIRWFIRSAGVPFHWDSLLAGIQYPTATHFLFGAAGALLGVSAIQAYRWRRSANA